MYDDLKLLTIGLGNAICSSKQGLVRNGADNPHWKEELKARCLRGLMSGIESYLGPDTQIRLIDTPYNRNVIGRGEGRNEMSCQILGSSSAKKSVTVLADIVDGTWNAACGVPWTASTMVALTKIEEQAKPADELVLSDFKCGLVVPLVGGIATPREPPGFYYGAAGEPSTYRLADSPIEHPLHATDVEDVRQSRFFLDLFTVQAYDKLAICIDAVKPLIYEWGDIGRFYGAGIELMSMLGTPGTTPGYGAYVAANQKADNLIPTKMLLEGAGVIVTNWWGEPIDSMKIMDRMYVAIAATRPLHNHLVQHLSKTIRLP